MIKVSKMKKSKIEKLQKRLDIDIDFSKRNDQVLVMSEEGMELGVASYQKVSVYETIIDLFYSFNTFPNPKNLDLLLRSLLNAIIKNGYTFSYLVVKDSFEKFFESYDFEKIEEMRKFDEFLDKGDRLYKINLIEFFSKKCDGCQG